MECNRISIRNFRNIEEAEVEFDQGVNILYGDNAQGKTNLLEAIGFTALGKSFRTSHEEEMIRFGQETAEISMDYTDSVRRQNITVRMMKGRRRRIEQGEGRKAFGYCGSLSDCVVLSRASVLDQGRTGRAAQLSGYCHFPALSRLSSQSAKV